MTATDHERAVDRLTSMLASDIELHAAGVRVVRSLNELPASSVKPYPCVVALSFVHGGTPRPSGFCKVALLLTVRAATREALAPLVPCGFRLDAPLGSVIDALARARLDCDGAGGVEWLQHVHRGSSFAFGQRDAPAYYEAAELISVVTIPNFSDFEVL